MRAFGRVTVRTVLLSGLSAVAIACAASFAFADPLPYLSPEAPPSFGDLVDASPLVVVFTTGRVSRSPALDHTTFAEQKFDPAPAIAPQQAPAAFLWNRHREEPQGVERRPSFRTGYGDAAIQNRRSGPSSLDRFASARDDGGRATETLEALEPALPDIPPPVVYDPTASAPLSPMQGALRASLEGLVMRDDKRNPLGSGDWRAARGAIAAFYASRAYAPVWVNESGLTEGGRAALTQLERARDDGLNLSAFVLPRDLGSGLEPDAIAEAETTMASAVVAYAEQATGSRVAPSHVSPLIFATPSVADPGVALAETAAAADPARRLADFNPPQKGYRALRDELKRLENPGVAERRFRVLSAELDPDPLLDLQEEGASQRTKRALNAHIHTASAGATFAVGASARQRATILANMEMWRWEPRDMGERRIEVNLADFSVAVLEGDRVLHQARVVVGKPETPTPIFSDVMRYVLINPSWQVPDSIIKKEMMSKLGALSRRGYEVKTVGGRLTVRQLPGDDNALGRFAFMFPNDHAIYLHDTPSKDLFDQETRAFSHGCIRLEDPQSLAVLVLGGESTGWTDERIEAAIGGKERTVFLARPLPIHIEYFTDFVDEFGEIKERPDVYGLIRKVEVILAQTSQD
jgi:L,D-transpeptidase YcbB